MRPKTTFKSSRLDNEVPANGRICRRWWKFWWKCAKDDNGLKTVILGNTLSGDEIQDLRKRVESGRHNAGAGKRTPGRGRAAYKRRRICGRPDHHPTCQSSAARRSD